MKKTIFITGASTGLGRETARLFQSKGWNVVATMRNTDDGATLAELENVLVTRLDVWILGLSQVLWPKRLQGSARSMY